ncbi:MAG: low molecular weight phosphatase family protein [Haloferacaceae archaeon]
MSDGPVRLAFVCVRNAGRSRMATAFAERERDRRGLGDRVEILTGGTDPAEAVHDVVVTAMAEVGLDVSERVPRAISAAELRACDRVATMGCSTLDLGVDPGAAGVEVEDWALDDPAGRDLDAVRAIRDETGRRVVALFDDLAD